MQTIIALRTNWDLFEAWQSFHNMWLGTLIIFWIEHQQFLNDFQRPPFPFLENSGERARFPVYPRTQQVGRVGQNGNWLKEMEDAMLSCRIPLYKDKGVNLYGSYYTRE
ncbi:MAG: hypothetical protein O3B01_21245 [Planctomycetota bacterium]|nr:hypothetical protein [Planctomycetota bacterium]